MKISKLSKKVLSWLLIASLLLCVGCVKQEDISEDLIEESYIEYHFRNDKLLNQHYEKHGIDMGFDSPKEYESAASDVINNDEALSKQESEDNDFVFYIEDTNEFVVLSEDGYIRTYFLPDAGISYYEKQ